MFDKLSDAERVEYARLKLKTVIDRFSYLIALHENNALVVYSNTLSEQIPKSIAAHAFNIFREAMHQIEVVRLCALWDRPANDDDLPKNSIPTVVELIDKRSILDALADDIRAAHADIPVNPASLNGETDPVLKDFLEQRIKQRNAEYGAQRAEQARNELEATIKKARELSVSPLLNSVRNLRDKEIAHLLETTRREGRGTVEPMKYHDETKLIEASIPLVESLYAWVSAVGYNISEARDIYQRRAEALWLGCKFEVKG